MKSKICVFNILLIVICWNCQPNKTEIYMIGDSTMANKPLEGNPERGWGQIFYEFFNENTTVWNHAVNGRSSKSFIDEGRWQTVLDSLQPGNLVFIQFGHNDQKDYDSTRYAAPYGAYKENLIRFVIETKNKSAHPVLLTSIMRRRFDENGMFYDTHGEYPNVVRQVADSLDIPLIDLHKSSQKLIESFGRAKSKEIFLWVKPGEYSKLPQGREDNTHLSVFGARLIACLAAQQLKELKLGLSKFLKDSMDKCY